MINKGGGFSADKYPENDSNEQDFIPYEGLYDEGNSVLPDDDQYIDHDLLIDAEVMLPQNGEHMKAARVLGRLKNSDGKYIGKCDQNPILDTRMFNVGFPDVTIT